MSSTNRGAARQPNDFYATPNWVVDAIIPHIPVPGLDHETNKGSSVIDAGAGHGAIGLRLKAAGYTNVLGVEVDAATQMRCEANGLQRVRGDFLEAAWFPELVVMNPPFSLAEKFVRHALHCVGDGQVFALLRLAFLEGQARATLHREHPSDVFVLPRRPSFTGGGTDSAAYAWFAWGPGRGNRWSILDVPTLAKGEVQP